MQGEPLLNPATRKAETVLAEFRASRADVWSSKDVLQIIRRKTAPAAGAASSSVPSTPVAAAAGIHAFGAPQLSPSFAPLQRCEGNAWPPPQE